MANKDKLSPEEMSCATCGIRRKAEANPGSLWSRLWTWHTGLCPRWKRYQQALAREVDEVVQVTANM